MPSSSNVELAMTVAVRPAATVVVAVAPPLMTSSCGRAIANGDVVGKRIAAIGRIQRQRAGAQTVPPHAHGHGGGNSVDMGAAAESLPSLGYR